MAGQTEREKMLAGELYRAADAELAGMRRRAKQLCHRYNQHPADRACDILGELLGAATDAHLEPPFNCDYGTHIRLGRGVYANHNLVVLDCAEVVVGDGVLLGPNVVLSTAGHPLDPGVRARGLEFAHPIRLGNNVWVGANVSILGGVEIGENTVIGAGSVVTRSMPANCVAVGSPCRVIREL